MSDKKIVLFQQGESLHVDCIIDLKEDVNLFRLATAFDLLSLYSNKERKIRLIFISCSDLSLRCNNTANTQRNPMHSLSRSMRVYVFATFVS